MPNTIQNIIERLVSMQDEMSITANPLRDDMAEICEVKTKNT